MRNGHQARLLIVYIVVMAAGGVPMPPAIASESAYDFSAFHVCMIAVLGFRAKVGIVGWVACGYDGGRMYSGSRGGLDMVAKPVDQKEMIYGIAPVPIDPDDMPDRIPIEMMQSSTIQHIMEYLKDLEAHLGDVVSLLMLSNLPIRYDPENKRVFVAPDWYVSFNVHIEPILMDTAYELWEIGKPPEWALEVASFSTFQRDMFEKPEIYARIGIREYWMFDPTGGRLYGETLSGYRLEGGEYERIEIVENEHGLASGYSEELRLQMCALEVASGIDMEDVQRGMMLEPDYNPARLLFRNMETGLYIPSSRGWLAQAEREARESAEREARERVDAAEARAERAEAELARLRGTGD